MSLDHLEPEGVLAQVATMAPGTPLREGFERILRGRTGALIVLGNTREVQQLCTGGFLLDVPYTPTALRELAKMDGAIVLDTQRFRIVRAGVHLMPDPVLETIETGTRHRTADRVAQQTGVPVVTISASMSTISLYVGGQRRVVEHSEHILSRANQALQTLERYRGRLSELTNRLSALEVHDQVSVKDVALVAQQIEMVHRLQLELEGYVIELGTDGRLLSLQLFELSAGRRRAARATGTRLSARRRDGLPAGRAGHAEHSGAARCLDGRPRRRSWTPRRRANRHSRLPTGRAADPDPAGARRTTPRTLRRSPGAVRGQRRRSPRSRRRRREPSPDHPRRARPAGRRGVQRATGLTNRPG